MPDQDYRWLSDQKWRTRNDACFTQVRPVSAHTLRVYATIGLDPLPGQIEVLDLASLSVLVRKAATEADKDGLLQTSKSDAMPEADKTAAEPQAVASTAATGAALASVSPAAANEQSKLAAASAESERSHVPH
jgi:hypothetical protein